MAEAIQATADTVFPPARKPTLYFIGMTTGKSSIMKVFPAWAKHLGLGDVAIQGIDCNWHDDPIVYRRVVQFLKGDPLSLGALVTTHKIDLYKASKDLFEYFDPYANVMGEISCISKRDGHLRGHAKDPITSRLGLEAFLPENHWSKTGGEAFCVGAGGSSIAISCYMMSSKCGENMPSKIVVSNRSTPRLEEIRRIHKEVGTPVPVEYHHALKPEQNDALMNALKPHSLVMNATGLGKDAPGSPLTSAGRFPENGYAWDFNYRGDLLFLNQARAQEKERKLTIEDGWVYFIHGWTRVVAEVFDLDIPTHGPKFDDICRVAKETRS